MKFITQKPLWINILVGILLAVMLFFFFILSLRWITHHGASKTVPDVVGQNYDQAVEALENKGFEVVVQDSIYQDTLKPHDIVKQLPEGDAVVKVNRTIYLTINRMVPPDVEVPNLVGYSLRNAEMILKNLGLHISDTVYKPDFARNNVLEQRQGESILQPGTKLRMGTGITLVLGTGVGQNNFLVPELRGYTYLQARAVLDRSGLIAVPILADTDITDTLSAYVIRQSPERLDETGLPQKLRSGEMMTLILGRDKPLLDSIPDPNPEAFQY